MAEKGLANLRRRGQSLAMACCGDFVFPNRGNPGRWRDQGPHVLKVIPVCKKQVPRVHLY